MSSGAVKRTSTGKLSRSPASSTKRPHPVERLGARLPRDLVLHLVEPHEPGAGEDAVAAVDVLLAPRRRQRPGQARRPLRPAPAHPAQRRRRRSSPSAIWSHHCFHRGRGASGSVVRLLRLVRAQPVCGTQKNSKWSLPSTRASRSARTASTRIGSLTARRWNAGTSCSVTVDTSPSGAHADPGGVEHLGLALGRARHHRAVAGHDPHADDLGRQPRQPGAGAVGGGGGGAGDGLVGDVAEVGQGQAAVVEGVVEVLEAHDRPRP